MLGLQPERLRGIISEGAADKRRAHARTHSQQANLSCSWIGSRCRVRTRRVAEPQRRGTRIARDAVPLPAVVSDLTTPGDVVAVGADDAVCAVLGLDNAGGTDNDSDDDPNQLSLDQLETRRRSSRTASTSASVSTSSLDGAPQGSRGIGAGLTTAAAFPTFPRPRTVAAGGRSGGAAAAGSSPAGPLPPAQVPPEAAQLYAGTIVAGNLSSTVGSSDVLIPLLDTLQLEPPAPSGPGGISNAQRVYRTATAAEPAGGGAAGAAAAAAGGADAAAAAGGTGAAASGAAALPLQVRRKRARTRVLDTSELLLARDEAVRTELISRTWNDLLRFEERLSGGGAAAPGVTAAERSQTRTISVPAPALVLSTTNVSEQQQQQESAAQPPTSDLDEVLGFLRDTVAVQRDQQVAEQVAQQVQRRRAEQRSARLMGYVRRAQSWQRLARLYVKHGRSFSVSHLIAALEGLASFWAAGRVYRGRSRRSAFDRVWDMLTRRLAFAGPHMSGFQMVRVVNALGTLPFQNPRQVEHTLVAVQRVLRYAQHALQPAPLDGPADSGSPEVGLGDGAGGRVVLNASEVARRRGDGVRLPLGAAARRYSLLGLDRGGGVEAEPLIPMGGEEYAALCYALGRINSRARPWRQSLRLPPSVSRRLLLGSFSLLGSMGPRELAGLLYGLGCMRLSPPAPWMYGFYVSSVRCLPVMSDVQLTMVMYGACRMKRKPPPAWIESYLAALGPRLERLDGTGLAAAAHALGRLKYKPRPGWVEAFMGSTVEVLTRGGGDGGGMSGCEMSQLCRGLMFLGLRPPGDVMEALWEASGRAMEQGEISAAQVANLAWALGNLKVPMPRPWYDQLVLQMRRNHKQLRPYHRRRLLSALHAFGCRDLPRWYQALRIPLVEMPGYATWAAQQAKQRAGQHPGQQGGAKAARQGRAQRQGQSVAQLLPAVDPLPAQPVMGAQRQQSKAHVVEGRSAVVAVTPAPL